jgi:hypothetical protein
MIRNTFLAWINGSHTSRPGARPPRSRRFLWLDGLEDRVLLSVYTVKNTSGLADVQNSLPNLVQQAENSNNPAGSVIQFDPSVFNASTPGIINLAATLDFGNPAAGPVTIQGALTSAGQSNIQIDGGDQIELFGLGAGVSLTISGVTLQDGANLYRGGAIVNGGGNLTVTNTAINNCTAVGYDTNIGTVGGLGGAIEDSGPLTLTDCSFSGDQATAPTGNDVDVVSQGGAVFAFSNSALSITDCTFDNDQAESGGGIYLASASTNYGATNPPGMLTVTGGSVTNCTGSGIFEANDAAAAISSCTLSKNVAGPNGYGGGILNYSSMTLSLCTVQGNAAQYGDGIANLGTMTINSSTIQNNNNSGGSGGGIYTDGSLTVNASTIAHNNVGAGMGGGIYADKDQFNGNSSLYIDDSTIANNEAGAGGGLYAVGSFSVVNCTIAYNNAVTPGAGGGLDIGGPSFAIVENTIVAANTDSNGADDIVGYVDLGDFNLIGTGSGGLPINAQGNIVGVANPGLGQLADNGGPTQTIALDFGSPAVGAGNVTYAQDVNGQPLPFDQRGTGFPRVVGGTVNIGAVQNAPTFPRIGILHVGWGPDGLVVLATAPDGISQLPAGRKHDLPWIGIDSFQFSFTAPALLTAADVMVQSARGMTYGPITVTGSGMNDTVTFAQPIDKADRVTITLDIMGRQIFAGRFNVLPGDVDDLGVVNGKDLATLRKDMRGKSSAQALLFGDLLGAGTVSSDDLSAAEKYRGTKLPRLRHLAPKVTRSALSPFALRKELVSFRGRRDSGLVHHLH